MDFIEFELQKSVLLVGLLSLLPLNPPDDFVLFFPAIPCLHESVLPSSYSVPNLHQFQDYFFLTLSLDPSEEESAFLEVSLESFDWELDVPVSDFVPLPWFAPDLEA